MPATLAPLRVTAAYELARVTLRELPDRWRHTCGVAARAAELAGTVAPHERVDLVAAAWLHDIGYAAHLVDTGFHPLDGARALSATGWPERIAALVAHHSGACFVAPVHDLAGALARYAREVSPVSDALSYADQTVGPLGQRMRIEDRLEEAVRRHGPASAQAMVYRERADHLLQVAARVERRLVGSRSLIAAPPRSRAAGVVG